ncbi:hypothetical protein BGW41_000328 [Actinomortierella wolfii]|nr:hypothetical protein BGW41_000328 [Actinomortierella wolfii]
MSKKKEISIIISNHDNARSNSSDTSNSSNIHGTVQADMGTNLRNIPQEYGYCAGMACANHSTPYFDAESHPPWQPHNHDEDNATSFYSRHQIDPRFQFQSLSPGNLKFPLQKEQRLRQQRCPFQQNGVTSVAEDGSLPSPSPSSLLEQTLPPSSVQSGFPLLSPSTTPPASSRPTSPFHEFNHLLDLSSSALPSTLGVQWTEVHAPSHLVDDNVARSSTSTAVPIKQRRSCTRSLPPYVSPTPLQHISSYKPRLKHSSSLSKSRDSHLYRSSRHHIRHNRRKSSKRHDRRRSVQHRALELPELQYLIGLYLEPRSLAACVRVCRSWWLAYMPLLWNTITGRNGLSPKLTVESLHQYGHLIRTVADISHDCLVQKFYYGQVTHLTELCVDMEHIRQAISLDSERHHGWLEVSNDGVPSLQQTLVLDHVHCFGILSDQYYRHHGLRQIVVYEHSYPFLRHFPDLERLTINVTDDLNTLRLSEDIRRYCLRAKELEIDGSDHVMDRDIALLIEAVPQLVTLNLYCWYWSSSVVRALLQYHRETIEVVNASDGAMDREGNLYLNHSFGQGPSTAEQEEIQLLLTYCRRLRVFKVPWHGLLPFETAVHECPMDNNRSGNISRQWQCPELETLWILIKGMDAVLEIQQLMTELGARPTTAKQRAWIAELQKSHEMAQDELKGLKNRDIKSRCQGRQEPDKFDSMASCHDEYCMEADGEPLPQCTRSGTHKPGSITQPCVDNHSSISDYSIISQPIMTIKGNCLRGAEDVSEEEGVSEHGQGDEFEYRRMGRSLMETVSPPTQQRKNLRALLREYLQQFPRLERISFGTGEYTLPRQRR